VSTVKGRIRVHDKGRIRVHDLAGSVTATTQLQEVDRSEQRQTHGTGTEHRRQFPVARVTPASSHNMGSRTHGGARQAKESN
jgi:hypothetical protein